MRGYLLQSKSLANSFLFILPLLVMYEVGIALYGSDVKNTADVMVKTPLAVFGQNGSLIFNLIVTIIFFFAMFRVEKRHRLRFGIFIPMFFEGIIYALFLGPIVGYSVGFFCQYILSAPMTTGIGMQILLSVGAGVYEEIVFRLLLLSGLNMLFIRILKINGFASIMLSIIIGSVVFSATHYVGPLSDTFTGTSFLFRFLAGLFLSAIFMFRGLGIAVYTHSIYDVLLVLRHFMW